MTTHAVLKHVASGMCVLNAAGSFAYRALLWEVYRRMPAGLDDIRRVIGIDLNNELGKG